MSSDDDGATWTPYTTISGSGKRILKADDGEVLVVQSAVIQKSSGWAGGTPTWATVVTANGNAFFVQWGLDGNGTKFICTEYSGSADRADSRYVKISTDSGDNWSTVWDTDAQFSGLSSESHLHGCCYDPWEDRFWMMEGHGTPAGIRYSDDDGATWNLLDLGDVAPESMPTVAVATPNGIVFGSDDDGANGVLLARTTANPADMVLEVGWLFEPDVLTLTLMADRGFYDATTGWVFIGFQGQRDEDPPCIAVSDGATALGLHRFDEGVAGDRVYQLAVTPAGTLVAALLRDGGTTEEYVRGVLA